LASAASKSESDLARVGDFMGSEYVKVNLAAVVDDRKFHDAGGYFRVVFGDSSTYRKTGKCYAIVHLVKDKKLFSSGAGDVMFLTLDLQTIFFERNDRSAGTYLKSLTDWGIPFRFEVDPDLD